MVQRTEGASTVQDDLYAVSYDKLEAVKDEVKSHSLPDNWLDFQVRLLYLIDDIRKDIKEAVSSAVEEKWKANYETWPDVPKKLKTFFNQNKSTMARDLRDELENPECTYNKWWAE